MAKTKKRPKKVEKVPREKKRGKRKNTKKDVSIVYDVKEPFSWHRFWDEKIIQNWKAFKGYLDRKGILYLLMSPFRYRARLIFRLWLIVICIMGGVIPRLVTLTQELKAQYQATSFVAVEGKVFTSGQLTITPLMSSHKENRHVMAFNIQGASSSGVASTTNAYDVRLIPRQGVSKPEEIFYRYQIVAFNATQRILIIELDASQATDTGGSFDLYINQTGTNNMSTPLDIPISTQQLEKPIYDGTVHLSALSKLMSSNNNSTTVKLAEDKMLSALQTYKLEYDRLKSMGSEMSITPEQMMRFVAENTTYASTKDDSTTDIVTDAPMTDKTAPVVTEPYIAVKIGDKVFDSKTYKEKGSEGLDSRYASDILSAVEQTGKVTSALRELNNAKRYKYTELYNLSRILSKELDESNFTQYVRISEVKLPGSE